jgi:ubiquinone/menaquinone biosynthesis C-methylase UbiE
MEKKEDTGRRFHGDPGRLRSAERAAVVEPERVVVLSLEGDPVKTVLDVGTGTGLFAEAFSASGLDVTGVDVNASLLAVARHHLPQGRFLEAPAESLPFANGSFGIVFMAHVLHEVDDPLIVFREAARTARKRVVIVEWPFREEAYGPPLKHRLPPERIEGLAHSAGLSRQTHVSLSHVEFYSFLAV